MGKYDGILISMDSELDFLYDTEWLTRHGYVYHGAWHRSDNVPKRWAEYRSRIQSGWLPSLREFAAWHFADQHAFEIEYVYSLTPDEQKLYYEHHLTFWLKPLDAINFYINYITPLDLSRGIYSLEIYYANHFGMKAEYDKVLGGFRFTKSKYLTCFDDIKDIHFIRYVLNGSTVYVVFYGRVVFDRGTDIVIEEMTRCIRDGRLNLSVLSVLSQEGY